MAFPTTPAVTESAITTNGTTLTVAFTQTTGDRVVVIIALNAGTGAETISLSDSFVNLTNHSNITHIIYKDLDGSEGGNVVVTVPTSRKFCAIAYNIAAGTFDTGQAPVFSTVATNINGTPDSSSLSPSWGSADNLWISAFNLEAEEADDDTWTTGAPTSYTDLAQTTTSTGAGSGTNACLASAERANATGTEDPSNFTTVQTDRQWTAYTIAIKPAAAGGGGDVFFENRHPIEQGMKPQTAAGIGGVLQE